MCGSLGGLKKTADESEIAAWGQVEQGGSLFVSSGILMNTLVSSAKLNKVCPGLLTLGLNYSELLWMGM